MGLLLYKKSNSYAKEHDFYGFIFGLLKCQITFCFFSEGKIASESLRENHKSQKQGRSKTLQENVTSRVQIN